MARCKRLPHNLQPLVNCCAEVQYCDYVPFRWMLQPGEMQCCRFPPAVRVHTLARRRKPEAEISTRKFLKLTCFRGLMQDTHCWKGRWRNGRRAVINSLKVEALNPACTCRTALRVCLRLELFAWGSYYLVRGRLWSQSCCKSSFQLISCQFCS